MSEYYCDVDEELILMSCMCFGVEICLFFLRELD